LIVHNRILKAREPTVNARMSEVEREEGFHFARVARLKAPLASMQKPRT